MKWNKSKKKLRGWQSYRLFLAEKKEFFCSDSDWFGFTHMCFSRFIWFDVTVYVFIVHHALQYSLDRKVHWQLYGHCTTVLYWGVEFYFSYFLFPNFLYFYSYFCFLLIFFPCSHCHCYCRCISCYCCHCWLHFCPSGCCHCPCYCSGLFAHTYVRIFHHRSECSV